MRAFRAFLASRKTLWALLCVTGGYLVLSPPFISGKLSGFFANSAKFQSRSPVHRSLLWPRKVRRIRGNTKARGVTCGGRKVGMGDLVQMHYSVRDGETGEIFMSTWELGEPMNLITGEGLVVPIIENSIQGMEQGEKKTVKMEPGKAFGVRDPKRVIEIPLGQIPPGVGPGAIMEIGESSFAKLVEIRDNTALVDINNPLADRPVDFEFEILRIASKPEPFTQLRMKTVIPGDGESKPQEGNCVRIFYIGYLRDGSVFDENRSKEPFSFILGNGRVVQGIEIAVKNMTLGQRVQIEVPSKYGYDEYGAPGLIPPNSDLIFDIELVGLSDETEADLNLREVMRFQNEKARRGEIAQNRQEISTKPGDFVENDLQEDTIIVARGKDGEMVASIENGFPDIGEVPQEVLDAQAEEEELAMSQVSVALESSGKSDSKKDKKLYNDFFGDESSEPQGKNQTISS
ncbi:hypothetical protein AAMO2058_001163200 [Amorphochlora amoebiformis]